MDVHEEVARARELVQTVVGEGQSERNNVLSLREYMWRANLALDALREARDAQVFEARKLMILYETKQTAKKYMQIDVEDMKNYEAASVDTTQLVDIETFLADNPNCTVQPDKEVLFLMERYKDEEQRRFQLFTKRRELEAERKVLRQRVDELKNGLALSGRYGDQLNSFRSNFKRMGEHICR